MTFLTTKDTFSCLQLKKEPHLLSHCGRYRMGGRRGISPLQIAALCEGWKVRMVLFLWKVSSMLGPGLHISCQQENHYLMQYNVSYNVFLPFYMEVNLLLLWTVSVRPATEILTHELTDLHTQRWRSLR